MSSQAPKARTIKFNFDTVFADQSQGAVAPAARQRSTFSSDEVERIRNETFAAGKADAEVQAATAKAGALSAIAGGLTALIEHADETQAALRAESAQLALAIARKLAAAALEAAPLREVEAIVTDCLHKLHREPRLVVRVAPALGDALQDEIKTLADRLGYAGRIVVLPESSLRGADCRVEWAGGGLERDHDANLAAIDEAVVRWRSILQAEESQT